MPQSYSEIYRPSKIWERILRVYRRGGLFFVATSALRLLGRNLKTNWLDLWYRLTPPPYFVFRGRSYPYLRHRYNATWQNERAVEVPIVDELVRSMAGKRILEVGNVLGHYGKYDHDVLDKYEGGPGILTEDAADFLPVEPYDMIVSVSTIEHIGFDEDIIEPEKPLRVLKHLIDRVLKPGGELVVTLPMGWNPHIDSFLRSGRIAFAERWCLIRTGPRSWREADWREIEFATYDRSVPTARAVVIGFIRKSIS